MHAAVIINPVSGSPRMSVDERVTCARTMLHDLGLEGRVVVTSTPNDATALTREFVEAGVSTIVAWGGDGTINQVASAAAFHGPALGIVPGGSGNGLARELHIPWEPKRALRVALTGRTTSIDAGELGGRLFFNVAGIGFDAHLARVFNERGKRGAIGYATSTLRQIFGYQAQHYDLRIGELQLRQRALVVVLANTRQWGNNALIAPLARPDDGLLEVVVLPDLHPLAALWYVPRLFLGSLHKIRGVTMRSAREIEISGDQLQMFHVDGEVVQATSPVSARVHPQAIAVRVP